MIIIVSGEWRKAIFVSCDLGRSLNEYIIVVSWDSNSRNKISMALATGTGSHQNRQGLAMLSEPCVTTGVVAFTPCQILPVCICSSCMARVTVFDSIEFSLASQESKLQLLPGLPHRMSTDRNVSNPSLLCSSVLIPNSAKPVTDVDSSIELITEAGTFQLCNPGCA